MALVRRDRTCGRSLVALLVASGAAVSLTSCVAPPSGGQQQPPATVTVTPGAGPGGGSSGADDDSGDRTSKRTTSKKSGSDDSDQQEAAGPQNCRTQQLAAKLYPEGTTHGGGAGVDYGAVRLANTSGTTCTLHGFGKISTQGETAPIRAQHDSGVPVQEFTLRPGEGVVKDLTFERMGSACTKPQQLKITPPGNNAVLTVPWHFTQLCDAGEGITLKHSPVHGGSDSNGIQIPGASAGR